MTLLSSSEKNKLRLIHYFIITLPFLLFYWMMPFVSNLTIGNDYPLYSIQWQMELLFSIKKGSFPLYMPGFTFGHSTSAMSLGQIYHPLPYLSSILPGYWDGAALQWNTFLRLLSLGLTHLALFGFLKKIRVSTLFAFLLSCITVYNMRMLDLFRFGASLEAYTGFLLLCTASGWYFLNPSRLFGPLSIIGSTYWLVCSGHPSMMFYGMLGVGLFLLVSPLFQSAISEKNFIMKNTFWYWTKVGTYIILGILLSSAFILPYYFDFIQWNVSRLSQNYDFSLGVESFYGTVSNFFMPFYSDIHGAFGGSSLFLLAMILPVLRFFKVRIPYQIYIIWGLLMLLLLYMLGDRTPLHRWVWEYVPFASSVRNEGRISIIIPILIMLLLAWTVNAKSSNLTIRNSTITLNPYVLLASISLILIWFFILISFSIKPNLGAFPPVFVSEIPLSVILITSLFGIASLAVIIPYNAFPSARNVIGILLCIAVLIHLGWILRFGTFVEERHDQPTFNQMEQQKKETVDFPFHEGAGMFSSIVIKQMDNSFLEPSLAKLYTHTVSVSDQEEAYEKMRLRHFPQQIFVENYSTEKALLMTDNARNISKGIINLNYSSFNRMQFDVISDTPAFFGLSYPYNGHWKAWVNGIPVHVYRANGYSHAVELPVGESQVEFRYGSPAAFWGIVISSSTFLLVGLYFCFLSLKGLSKAVAAFILLTITVGFVSLWNNSLYNSDNFDTQYSWTYSPVESIPNLAYGKSTPIPYAPTKYEKAGGLYFNHRSSIVDGNKSNSSGYMINLKKTPPVTIDLYEKRDINSIIIYESIKEPADLERTLELFASMDNDQWSKIFTTSSRIDWNNPVEIEFQPPVTTRHIKIKASGYGKLFLEEVEIY